jgi:predicted metalloprotease with PDZ domain
MSINALFTLTALVLSSQLAAQQEPVEYEIAFPNAVHHEAEVSATFTGLGTGPAQLRMSRSSPGRYALHEFAKNVYSVSATDSRGTTLPVTRANPHQWNVSGHDGTVTVHYTLYADRADGTYSGIDLTHSHLNMPATFMFARGTEARPIRVTFRWTNPAWRIATQLAPTADTSSTHATFTAPHLQYFFDSPTEISEHALYTWRDSLGGPAQTIRMALHHAGTKAEADAYAERVKGIVSELAALFGEFPDFDFGTYTFLADYLPWDSGDGMEHRNSTVVSSTGSLARSANQLLGTVAHEFTHAWNVERIRPTTLEPFDFERENMSNELWLAEGFTNYIGQLVMRRAGVYDDRTFAAVEGRGANAVMNNPGRQFFSPVGMSQQAPFVDAASSIDPQNKQNTFISYYTYGQALALALDLTMRMRGELTLDDFMRGMWAEFGRDQRNYAPARTYTVDDARKVLGKVTGDQAFADDFFRRYVTGQESPDFAPLFAAAGFRMQPPDSSRAWLGASIRVNDGAAELRGNTLIGTPLYEAGLDRGDRIVSLGGRAIDTQAALDSVIAAHQPGDAVPVVFESRGMTRNATLTFAVDPSRDVVPFEDAGEPLTDSVRAFRARWLGSRVSH